MKHTMPHVTPATVTNRLFSVADEMDAAARMLLALQQPGQPEFARSVGVHAVELAGCASMARAWAQSLREGAR